MSDFRPDRQGADRELDALFSGGTAGIAVRGGAGGGGRRSREPLMADFAERVEELARYYVLVGYERPLDDRPENERNPGTLRDSIRVRSEDSRGPLYSISVEAEELVTWKGTIYDVAEIIHQGHRAFSSRSFYTNDKGERKRSPLIFQARGDKKLRRVPSVPAVREYPFLWQALVDANKEFLRDRGFGFILKREERGVLEGEAPSRAVF